MTPDVVVLMPAGGVGVRMGRRTPKQYLRLGGAPIIAATLRGFLRHPAVRAVVIAAPAAHVARTRRLLGRQRVPPTVEVVAGGAERQESVWRALQAAPADAEIVLVHDAVRPFITPALIERVPRRRGGARGGHLRAAVRETVKRVRTPWSRARSTARGSGSSRRRRRSAGALLREAHDKARRDGFVGTDDAMLVERLGAPVRVVAGLPENLKITTPEDLTARRRSAAVEPRRPRLRPPSAGGGTPADPGRRDRRRGRGLGGHSDADVLTHAIGEALLGALALGDLGRTFPDTDPRYRGDLEPRSAAGRDRAGARPGGRARERGRHRDLPGARGWRRTCPRWPSAWPRPCSASRSTSSVKAKSPEHLGLLGRERGYRRHGGRQRGRMTLFCIPTRSGARPA